VESWNVDGVSHVWVKVPELTAETIIYALWGKAGVDVPECTTNGAVWSEGFAAVWHMEQVAASDVSANGYNATVAGGSVASVKGVVGAGNSFNAGYLTTGSPVNTAAGTISLWFKSESVGSGQKAIFATGNTVYDSEPHTLLVRNGANLQSYAPSSYMTVMSIVAQRWYHVALVRDTGVEYIYVDGKYIKSRTCPTVGNNQNIYLGSGYRANFQGEIDEFRVSDFKRSAGWVWAEYMSVVSNEVFATYGEPSFQDLPYLKVNEVVEVTSVSGILTGTLVSTGFSATAVSVYWGRG